MEKCSIFVRKFKPHDLDSVSVIEDESFPAGQRYSRDVFLYYYRSRPDLFLVLEYCGMVVGYVIADYTSDFGHIVSIAVHPRYRGRGFGKRHMREVEERLLAKRVRVITLEVAVSNTVAINMYKKLGYKQVYLLPRYYGAEDALLMVKYIG